MSKIRVIALDDHPIILEGYQIIFSHCDGIEITQTFTCPEDMMNYLHEVDSETDVVLMDIHLKHDRDGVYWCQQVSKMFDNINILGASTYNEFGVIKSFLQAGGRGFVLKNEHPTVFEEAVRTVSQGERFLSQELKDQLLDQRIDNRRSNYYIPELSPRELEVIQLICEEKTTNEIAKILYISTKTVESHRTRIMEKLDVKNVAGLVREAIKKGYSTLK